MTDYFHRHVRALCCVVLLCTSVCADETAPEPAPSREQLDFFENRIRPVLSEHCYECHSSRAVAAGKLKGGLQLDTREGIRRGGDSGPALVPGNVDESLIVEALRYESYEMPPAGKLPDDVIADFVRWIETGAADPREGSATVATGGIDIQAGRQFWSFQPLHDIQPPAVEDESWLRTPIDAFILSRQEESSLHPNERAEPRTLIRRAYFDLIGLPPTPEAVEQFVQASESDFETAWSDLLDRLLASEHYGERWARHWMDIARFAESHGYEQDYDRPHAYHYRDFLIRALNSDMPYDRFVGWQLAGDELAPDDPLALMATGFLGAGAFPTQLTEVEFESSRYDELDDMVATTGVAFLGLSVGCARCHDHKFDPIPSHDYYAMAATFTTAIRSEIKLDLDPEQNELRRLDFETQRAELAAALSDYEETVLPGEFREWLADHDPGSTALSGWQPLEGTVTSSAGTTYVRQEDGSWLATGDVPDREEITIVAETRRTGIRAFRLEALADESLPHSGPGRAPNGNFALGDVSVSAVSLSDERSATEPGLIAARATHQQNDSSLSVSASIDEDPVSGWAVDGQIGQDQAAVFVCAEPVGYEGGTRLSVKLTFHHPNTKHVIGRLRLSVGTDAAAQPVVGESGPPADVLAALRALKEADDPGDSAWNTALGWFKTTQPEWQERRQALAAHEEAGPGVELTKVMVTSEGFPHMSHHADGRGFPHFYPQVHHLVRGDVHQKGDVAEQGFLQVLMRDDHATADWQMEPPEAWTRTSFRRAALANWITDVEDGAGALAARVIVNRLWQHHFGRGIVATPNDFGAPGERPTHPELLDWLANDLVENGWRMKRMHRQMMSSSVYLQSSAHDEQRAAIDRENTLHWRRTPRRLEAEPIRDAMLAIAGQLDTTMYGPGTLDPNMNRRSVYFFIKRSQLIPMMMLFDWPEHLVSIGQRASTTIAPQALMFLNGPQGRRYAEGFAARLEECSDEEAVRRAYLLAYGRPPDDRELELATAFLAHQMRIHDDAGQQNAARVARVDLCQTLFSMNEFVYVD